MNAAIETERTERHPPASTDAARRIRSDLGMYSGAWSHLWSPRLLVLSLVTLLVTSLILAWRIHSYSQAVSAAEHSEILVADIQRLLASLEGAETGERGFLLTGYENYLEPYNRALKSEVSQILSLRQGMTSDPQALAGIDRLAAINGKELLDMQEAIRLRRQKEVAAADELVREGSGKQAMDSMRAIISALSTQEKGNLRGLSARRQNGLIQVYILIGGTAALAFLCCLMAAASRFQKVGDNRFNLIANSIPQLAWLADRNGWIFWYNKRWYDYTGTNPEEMEGWGWQKVHDPQALPAVLARWEASIAIGEPFDMEFPLRGADGKFRMFVTRAAPVKDRKGRTFRWVGTNTDIEDLRRTQERLQRLYNSGIVGVFYWTEEGSITGANDKFLAMVGYSRQELEEGELRWPAITPPEYLLQDRHMLVRLREVGAIKSIEKEFLRKDGSRVHVELGAASSPGEHSMEGVAFVLDITQRKQTESHLADVYQSLDQRVRDRTSELAKANHKLAEIQAKMRAVLDGATGIAIISADQQGLITVFNTGAERMLQYSAEEVIGIHTLALFHSQAECNERCFELSRELGRPVRGIEVFTEPLRTSGSDEREWSYIRKDGTTLSVNVSTTAIRDEDERMTGFLGVASDITTRKALERQLRERNLDLERQFSERTEKLQNALAEKTVLLKEVHHRVKNNLAVVASLLGMQADSSVNDDATRTLLESQRRVHSMALIHEHLYGTKNLSRVRFDDYAGTLANDLYVAFSSPDRIRVQLDAAPVELPIDTAIPCGLILNELLSNAFKYAFPKGRAGRIVVSFSETENDCLTLAVSDDGVGFPHNLDWSRAETLGLKIVQILSQQLSGILEMHDGTGTHFKLSFPKNEHAHC